MRLIGIPTQRRALEGRTFLGLLEPYLEALARVLDRPFFRGYGLDRQGTLRLLERALVEGEPYALDPPLALAWYRPKGGFDRGYLRLLAVAETARGRGLGSLLMDFLEARGLEFVLAERANAQALRFYARRGFQEVGRLPGFVRPGREVQTAEK